MTRRAVDGGARAVRAAQVVVLAKSPVAGRVKTRLCPPYTPEQAAGLARAALLDTLRAARGASVRRTLLVLDGRPGPWLPAGTDLRRQRGGPLDERLAHAMTDAYADLAVPVLLVGMDTPQLTPAALDRAVDRLLAPGTDAVLGPAADGGFWALGLRRPRTEHVRCVPMSRPDTGARQRARLASLGLQVDVLDTLRDVDLATDAAEVARTAARTCFAAEHARLDAGAA